MWVSSVFSVFFRDKKEKKKKSVIISHLGTTGHKKLGIIDKGNI